MQDTDALDVAARLFAAVEAGNVAAVGQLYATDAVIWHSHTGTTQTAEENLQVLGLVTRRLRDLRYDEVRRQRTDRGFVQQHVLRARGPADHKAGEETREGQTLTYEPLKSLAAGATATYEVFVKGTKPGDARFKLDVTADQLKAGGPVHEEESTYIYSEVGPMEGRARRLVRWWWTGRRK